MVISVSRRCDIPRFSFGWFLERLDAAFVEVRNPFNALQVKRVSLLSPAKRTPGEECAELFAFWTRDPSLILDSADELKRRGYAFFVMVTLNAYPPVLEPNAPETEKVIQAMKNLAQKISRERVIWRYDPVFLSAETDFEFHRRNFTDLASRLSGSVARVIISVYDEYSKAEKRLARLEQSGRLSRLAHYQETGQGEKRLHPAARSLLAELAGIARNAGMETQSCAEEDLSDCGIKQGACIDGEYIAGQFGIKVSQNNPGKTRKNCLCAQSVDIGTYGQCPAGCVYCYGLG